MLLRSTSHAILKTLDVKSIQNYKVSEYWRPWIIKQINFYLQPVGIKKYTIMKNSERTNIGIINLIKLLKNNYNLYYNSSLLFDIFGT